MDERKKALGLYVTSRCNHRCGYCIYSISGAVKPNNMSADVAERILDMLLPDIRTVGITGGEPMLCPDIWKIIRLIKDRDVPVGITTNGTRIEKNKLLSGVSVTVSARESDRGLYYKLTGFDQFKRMVRGVRAAIASGAHVGVSFVIERQNISSMLRYALFAKSLGVERVAFMGLLAGARDDLDERLVINEDMKIVHKQRKEIDKIGIRITQWPKPLRSKMTGGKCTMADVYIGVDANGSVALCCRGPGPRPEMGNLFDIGPSVWSSGPMEELRRRVYTPGNQPEKCMKCRDNWGSS